MPDVRCACAKRVWARQAIDHSGTSPALFGHPPLSQRGSGHQSTRSGSPYPDRLPSRLGPGPHRPPAHSHYWHGGQQRSRVSRFIPRFDRSAVRGHHSASGFHHCGVVPHQPVNAEGVEVPSFGAHVASQPTSPGQRNGGTTPKAFRGAGAIHVVLASRPFLTGAPNPGMQRTRYARR